jgi:predicted nucleic acid-binding protein
MLLDTSGLLNLVHRSEPFFELANAIYLQAKLRLIHNYIVAEFVALANVRGLPRSVALEFAGDIENDSEVIFVWVDAQLQQQALQLLRNRKDKDYSLCDAVSFVLMRKFGIVEGFTTDHHFDQEGFVRLLQP